MKKQPLLKAVLRSTKHLTWCFDGAAICLQRLGMVEYGLDTTPVCVAMEEGGRFCEACVKVIRTRVSTDRGRAGD